MGATSTPVLTPPRVSFDEEVETRRTDDAADYTGWFCVATNPWPCPVAGCGFVAHYMTAAHLVVVWPRKDDPALLGQASSAKAIGRNPVVVEYERDFGPCISWDEWWRIGRPVHGKIDRPEGWDKDKWSL